MRKGLLFLLVILMPFILISQDYSNLWEGHFSYFNIKDVSQGNGKIYAASENAVFIYDQETEQIETVSTINGLSGETISTIHFSETYNLLLIGYENGLIEIVSDDSSDVLSVIDILDKPTIQPSNKKINHFNEFEDVVYISTDYGISVYNLNALEFGDTYFIGNLGSQIKVSETVIFGDYIYAACTDSNGLRKAIYSSNNLIDYQQWETVINGTFLYVQSLNGKLYVIQSNRKLYEVLNDSLLELFTYPDIPLDFKTINDRLIVTSKDNVYIYDNAFNLISEVTPISEFDSDFTSAIVNFADDVFIGTKEFGILKTSLSSLSIMTEIHPDGPLLNSPFSLEAYEDNLWVTYGEYSLFYNPYPLTRRGISHLIDENWINKPYDSVLGAAELNKISINPNNKDQVFISSFIDGILEVNDDSPTILYNETNSGLESWVFPPNPNLVNIRVGGANFDSNGLLWNVTSLVDNALKSFNPETNQWQSYSFSSIIEDPFSSIGFKELIIDNNENKWITSYLGLIGVKTNGNSATIKILKGEGDEGNLPSNDIRAIKLDDRNQLWIGTDKGLRVLYNPESLFSDDGVQADEIIIVEDGIPKELLFQQWISDIEVDGSNNKWIGTLTNGLFYFTENGQQTIYHFTTDNSPLPTNNIIDVSLDSSNGKVYIATDKGLVSFRSGGSKPRSNLETAFVYPNPVRPTFNITDQRVKIKDISENINIKITDIEGNLVAEAQSNTNQRYQGYNLEIDGGTAFWNGKNLANNVVASGVYLVLLSDLDTLETKVLKLMVIR
ncbi:MAG: ABC transporter substrate-binding protein [Flavobacteriaceae bacterium]|nr:ABC transporter substrate-binding protein [Bacteroidia bacterium]NNL15682.1 ABC transporter substrate-binding protein [Flavobacteriaceae bacterium]